jgi:putative membrane protein
MIALTEKQSIAVITALSITVPLVVALLLFLPERATLITSFDIKLLPLFNACINSTVTITLLVAFWAIRKKKVSLHKTLTLTALALSILFLISYVIYHFQAEHTRFGGGGFAKYIYFFILITHILLATAIIPLALLSIYRGLTNQLGSHKKIARWTLPIWLYVSISGVIVYLMISPYYQ